MNNGNIIESLCISTTFDNDSCFTSNNNFTFVVNIHLNNHIYTTKTTIDMWYIDSRISKHMKNYYN